MPIKSRLDLLRGTAQLAGEGFLGALDVVEGVHQAVLDPFARLLPFGQLITRTTDFVYARLRDVGQVASTAALGSLGLYERYALPRDFDTADAGASNAWVSALNGAIGDHLQETRNPLALGLEFCRNGQPLALDPATLARELPCSNGRLYVLVHGLGMNDSQWQDSEGDHFGARLERDTGGSALYLRYNSGLRISANGRELARRLQQLVDTHPNPIEHIVLIGHSMGGLVCRSACSYAGREALGWLAALDAAICLGSPHLGAPLERMGGKLSAALESLPYTRALAKLTERRSAGVKDLRHGWCSDRDRPRRERLESGIEPLADIGRGRWYLAAATLAGSTDGTRARWIGDGLVPVPSALGQHPDPLQSLQLPASQRHVFRGIGHMDLLINSLVYAKLKEWLD
ncbi:lipase family alpha/beta hydrolase [Tahibacter aquaticus]|uniref:lipase family alpha/beta hydrolase n=1 Tax=Tahibacter aquaticus TaxID=520092 RepID=UPI001414D71E|nr:alpha/beta fold hydrolase [Tahibacter aquaticus]